MDALRKASKNEYLTAEQYDILVSLSDDLKKLKGEQEMSQMPDKIWLHKNTKYSTGDIVCGYQYDFVQGIEDEGGVENIRRLSYGTVH